MYNNHMIFTLFVIIKGRIEEKGTFFLFKAQV